MDLNNCYQFIRHHIKPTKNKQKIFDQSKLKCSNIKQKNNNYNSNSNNNSTNNNYNNNNNNNTYIYNCNSNSSSNNNIKINNNKSIAVRNIHLNNTIDENRNSNIRKYSFRIGYPYTLNSCNNIYGLPFLIISINLILLLFNVNVMADCPRLCECKWKSGKESVLCLNANLTSIPERLDTGTQILDLTGNDITQIQHDVFSNSKLLNLQKIFLAKCRLKLIERYAFRNLTNLVELDLSYNQLTTIPSHSFDSIPELREIKLNGNPIQRIVNDAFARVPQLVRLELSDCKITSIEPRAFTGLESSIEWLKLDGNKLIEIRAETLTGLNNLHGLELARNLWNCSCRLRPLRAWMLRENIPYGVPPVCRMPSRLSGKPWDKIDLDDFACIPQIIAPDAKAHGVEGRNITMSCYIEGIPEPNVRWIVKNRVIANLTNAGIQGQGGETAGLTASTSQGRKMYMVNLKRNSSNLTILTAEVQDAGTYTCAAENKAGRVEASVHLAVSRKPPEAPLGARLILISVLVALIFVVGTSFLAMCYCSLRNKRRKLRLWHRNAATTRADSYEKIEMHRKPDNTRAFNRKEENGYLTVGMGNRMHGGENGIAVVQPTKKNGDYRNVPTEDDAYEDNSQLLENSFNKPKLNNNGSSGKSPNKMGNKKIAIDEKDLHIPRLIDLSSNNDQATNNLSNHVDSHRFTKTQIYSHNNTSSWSNQLISTNKKPSPLVNLDSQHSPTSYNKSSAEVNSSVFCSSRTPEDPLCDIDRTYPDLLDVYSYSNSNRIGLNNFSQSGFCTLPRKFKNSAKYFRNTSDSQSPLLPESSSKFGSGTFGELGYFDYGGRRFSAESTYTTYTGMRTTMSQRSSSFLNLVQATNKIVQQRNPSLPSSPVRDTGPKAFSSAATPLLDFSTLTNRTPIMPSTSTVSAYDYHAAQLERFLEEYRNLQDQLCKMKETCDSIRKKEARGTLTGHSAVQFADPVMFNGAIAETSLVCDNNSGNPKTILKTNKTLPGKQPEPPPYWLHRNAMLKRLNDAQSDFFKS